MLDLQSTFHQIRRFRNVLVHSAYQEMKAGGEVIEMLRANPNPVVDSETGEISFEVEAFTEENISARLKQLAEPSFRLGQHYVQLIHWAPFQRFLRRPSTT